MRQASSPLGSVEFRCLSLERIPHMRIVGVKRALHCLTNSCSRRLIGLRASPLVLFNSDQLLTEVGPVELWATHLASSKRSGKSTGLLLPPTPPVAKERLFRSRLPHYGDISCGCVAIRGSSPFIDCGFDARRTSHPVAIPRTAGTTIPHSQGHRAREGGSTLYVGISQPLFATVRPPGSNGADQARGGTRDNDSGPAKYLSLPS